MIKIILKKMIFNLFDTTISDFFITKLL